MPEKLKLVEPDPVKDYEPLFLVTQNLLDIYWGQVSEALTPCIDEAMNGEMTLSDIYEGIKAGRLFCLVAKNDEGELPDVVAAMILQLEAYPQYAVLDIVALGGSGLDLLRDKYWERVCGWAYMNGIRQLQASVSPAMARMLKSYGFKPVYQTLRMSLTEK